MLGVLPHNVIAWLAKLDPRYQKSPEITLKANGSRLSAEGQIKAGVVRLADSSQAKQRRRDEHLNTGQTDADSSTQSVRAEPFYRETRSMENSCCLAK